MFADRYADVLEPVFGDRRWIIAIDDLSATTPLVRALRELGSERVLVVAGAHGSGTVPDPEEAETCVVDLGRASTHRRDLGSWDTALVDLPPQARARMRAFDPDRRAQVITAMQTTLRSVAGRPIFGARDQAWLQLQDRAIVDRIWRVAGVRDVRREVVAAEPDALRTTAAELDLGQGTVWVSDIRDGWKGRDGYLRWVRNRVDADEAVTLFEGRARRVRVMPFLDGIPCSIDGLVFADDVVVLRPCEMLVLRRPGASTLCYASAATLWDPEPHAREEMRDTARAVGHHLRETIDYRGAFTIDGVMTADGFVPIELNPRYGSMLGAVARASGAPLYLLTLSLMAGERIDLDTSGLEGELLAAADAHRVARASLHLSVPRLRAVHAPLRFVDGQFVVVTEEGADALLTASPGVHGGTTVRLLLDTDRHPPGPSIAPKAVSAFGIADDLWHLGIGPLQAAPDLRPGDVELAG